MFLFSEEAKAYEGTCLFQMSDVRCQISDVGCRMSDVNGRRVNHRKSVRVVFEENCIENLDCF